MQDYLDVYGPYTETEVVRQSVHTRLVIRSTGLVPEALRERDFPHVLDIGCGPGEWLYEYSFRSPHALCVGTDKSTEMVKAAITRNALRRGCTFQAWDPFSSEEAPFREDYFDLITLHFASRWVPNQIAWLQLLNTCRLYLRRGGLLLIQEEDGVVTTSAALSRLTEIIQAAHRTTGRSLRGNTFQGEVIALMSLLRHAHLPMPTITSASVDFSYTHDEENVAWRDYFRVLIAELTPYLTVAGATTPEELCELSIKLDGQMFQEDFCGIWTAFSIVARKP